MDLEDINQSEVAGAVGHKPPWLSQFLSGKRKMPLASLDKIAHLFRVEPWQLVSGDPIRQRGTPASPGEPTPQHQARLLQLERREREAVGALVDMYGIAYGTLKHLGDLREAAAAKSDKAGARGRDSLVRRRAARAR